MKQIIIIGGGPAGLMAADKLSLTYNVNLYDKEKNIGQKFLVAGKGGFNLTNSVTVDELISKYSPDGFMNNAITNFDNTIFRQWLFEIGVPTYVGSSGRVFPEKGMMPIDVLNKIKTKLTQQGVRFHTQYQFVDFDNAKHVVLKHNGEKIVMKADYILFALGGASWPVTGSNGLWRTIFESMGIATNPFQASNCGVTIGWSETFKQNHAGKPLKNCKLFTNTCAMTGEAMITNSGMEGNALYALVPSIRTMLNAVMPACLYVDFKPMNTEEQLLQKVREKNITTKEYGRIFNLNAMQLSIIKAYSSKERFLSVTGFIGSLKKLEIPIESLRPIDEAISTIGGISLEEVNDDFSLKKYPWIYTIGEMLDWDAPTGGYLLQGCFSMGYFAAKAILEKSDSSI